MKAIQLIRKSFIAFGGWKATFTSTYLLLSAVITIIVSPFWISDESLELPIQILPSIIGFTLAGFAILLAFGDTEFLKKLSYREDKDHSPFYKFSSTFVIFIIVQTCSLLLSIFVKGWFSKEINKPIMEMFSVNSFFYSWFIIMKYIFHASTFFVFIYSLLLVVAAAVEIFRIVKWLEDYHTIEYNKSKKNGCDNDVSADINRD